MSTLSGVSADLGDHAGKLVSSTGFANRNCTVALWIYSAAAQDHGDFLAWWDVSGNGDIYLGWDTNNGRLNLGSNGGASLNGPSGVWNNVGWNHVVWRIGSGSSATLTVNGSSTSGGGFPYAEFTNVYLGGNSTLTELEGGIAVYAEWDSDIGASLVTDLYNGANPRNIGVEPSRYVEDFSGAGPHSPVVGTGDFTESGTVGDLGTDPSVDVYDDNSSSSSTVALTTSSSSSSQSSSSSTQEQTTSSSSSSSISSQSSSSSSTLSSSSSSISSSSSSSESSSSSSSPSSNSSSSSSSPSSSSSSSPSSESSSSSSSNSSSSSSSPSSKSSSSTTSLSSSSSSSSNSSSSSSSGSSSSSTLSSGSSLSSSSTLEQTTSSSSSLSSSSSSPASPQTPTNVTVSIINSRKLRVSWTNVGTVFDYTDVYRSLSENGPWTKIASVPRGTSQFDVEGLEPETTYWFYTQTILR